MTRNAPSSSSHRSDNIRDLQYDVPTTYEPGSHVSTEAPPTQAKYFSVQIGQEDVVIVTSTATIQRSRMKEINKKLALWGD